MEKLEKLALELDSLTLGEARELINILQNKYGYTLPTAVTAVATSVEEVKEQTEFNVVLTQVKDKLKLIKALKGLMGGTTSLIEAKNIVEKDIPNTLKENVSKEEAEMWKTTLMENEMSTIELK